MNLKKSPVFFIVILFISCAQAAAPALIPQPISVEIQPGKFTLSASTSIRVSSPELNNLKSYLNNKIYNRCNLSADENISRGNIISFVLDSSLAGPCESYSINISRDSILFSASSTAGLFYASQTFLQMLPYEPVKKARLKCLKINDAPRFCWRGLNLDCSRHFMEKNFILRYLDLMAYYKMNVFHWHLTDDQAWRLEIKKYPLLTQIGSVRKNKQGELESGFYSQEDVKEIVAYAADRNITVIPEIEMPGHATAALAAYPEYSCTGGPFTVENKFGVHKDVFCAGNDKVFDFLENILTEIMALFPSEYIHIGGDEVPKDRWKNCAECQERILSEGLADEEELQSYFIKRIEDFLTENNRRLIGWDEILQGETDSSTIIQCWRRDHYGKTAAETGHPVIMSPVKYTYFNSSESRIDLKKAYDFSVRPNDLSSKYCSNILGSECSLWTEYTPQNMVDQRLFPRLTAFSEAVWTQQDNRDFSRYYKALQSHFLYLNSIGVTPGPEAQPVKIIANIDSRNKEFSAVLVPAHPELVIHYSLKDSCVSLKDPLNKDTLKFHQSSILSTQAFMNGIPYGRKEQRTFIQHLAWLKPFDLKSIIHKNYQASGKNALVDGIMGSDFFLDGIWQGYEGEDILACIDLEKPTSVHHISCGFLQRQNSWIFMPCKMDIEISDDSLNFTHLASVQNYISPKTEGVLRQRLVFDTDFLQTRFIRIKVHSLGSCPNWHQGAGGKAWIFADEIIVK